MSLLKDKNLIALEKTAGNKAARTIQRNWKTVLATATTKRTGLMLQLATASANMKFDSLDSISIKATPATFIQHYGFESNKSNGLAMRRVMKPYHHFDNLFKMSEGALQRLVAELAEIRGAEVSTKIQEIIKFNWTESQT